MSRDRNTDAHYKPHAPSNRKFRVYDVGVSHAPGYKKSKELALTLVELMVCLGLLAGIMTLCFLVFVSAWRKFQSTSAVQDTQTSALFGLNRFSQDFRETTIDFIVYGDGNGFMSKIPNYSGSLPVSPQTGPVVIIGETYPRTFIAFPSPRDGEGKYVYSNLTGQKLWQSWIVYYLEKESDIEEAASESDTTMLLTIYKLIRIVVNPMELYPGPSVPGFFEYTNLSNRSLHGNWQTVAHNIYSFEMRGRAVSDDIYSYDVTIATRKDYRGKQNTFRATRVFSISDPLHR